MLPQQPSSSSFVLVLVLVLVPVLLALGALLVVSLAAAAYFTWSRERCRRDSCEEGLVLGVVGGERRRDSNSSRNNKEDADGTMTGVTGAGDLQCSVPGRPSSLSRRASDEAALIQQLVGKKSLGRVTADDIKGLSKEEFMRLFALLPPATPEALHGEWCQDVLAMGWCVGWWFASSWKEEGALRTNAFVLCVTHPHHPHDDTPRTGTSRWPTCSCIGGWAAVRVCLVSRARVCVCF
jgi:hypothetical protein